MQSGGVTPSCGCFVARHAQAAAIEAALLRGEDPRDVAARYNIGKSRVYDHRKHIRGGAPVAARAGDEEAPAVPPVSDTATPPVEPVRGRPRPFVERSTDSMERVEPRVESGGMRAEAVPAAPAISSRALPHAAQVVPSSGAPAGPYATAVKAAVALITEGKWRSGHVDALVEKYGIARNSARAAHAEAARHLQMNMGDYLARQAVSASYVVSQRDGAKAQSANALRHAERWRDQEHRAQEAAEAASGKEERLEKLKAAAHFGLLATKYDLSAEKWSAQALAHQRHLDDILCLRSPREVHATQNNFGADTGATFASFAAALARRFADRPDVLAELEAAAAEIERAQEPGDGAAMVTTWEAA